MKKLIVMLIALLCLMPLNIWAAGSITVSTTNLNITNGSSATFKITANNAAGRVEITSSNPGVASVSSSSLFLDMQSGTITVRGLSVGSTTIKVYSADVTTYDDENISGRTQVINVNVKEPVYYSTNNELKSISVDGYELEKIDEHNYKLSVNNDVSSINVNAEAVDDKARVTGIGAHTLDIGENQIEVLVTSESGNVNRITLTVLRKDGYYLEDLQELLKDNSINDVDIILENDTKILPNNLNDIKESGKLVRFNYYNENKEVIYSWIVDGKKITDTNEFLTSVEIVSPSKEVLKLSNYASGLQVNINNLNQIPSGISLKLNVKNYYEDNSKVNLYSVDLQSNKLDEKSKELAVANGMIELSDIKDSKYLLTMSQIGIESGTNSTSGIIWMIISLCEFGVILAFVVALTIKKKSK
ncbi:MAG: Ig-like domain-containing protein [Bacilli bacterium]|nr:Ig-like domain-containing protein [Bacilli bacterium]